MVTTAQNQITVKDQTIVQSRQMPPRSHRADKLPTSHPGWGLTRPWESRTYRKSGRLPDDRAGPGVMGDGRPPPVAVNARAARPRPFLVEERLARDMSTHHAQAMEMSLATSTGLRARSNQSWCQERWARRRTARDWGAVR